MRSRFFTSIQFVRFLILALMVSPVFAGSRQSSDHVGSIEAQDLLQRYPSFQQEYERYALSDEDRKLWRDMPSGLRISVYFGTWCHDSQREVPRLLRGLESHSGELEFELYGLDHNKADPAGRAKSADIRYTPTIVIYSGEEEKGRIIEKPEISLAKDIYDLVQKLQ